MGVAVAPETIGAHLRAGVLMGALLAGGSAAAAEGGGLTDRLKRLFSFDEPGSGGLPTQRIDCPGIQVDPGQSAVRVGGEGATSVRYQISIGDVARECAQQGDKLAIRVGVETRVVLGAAGSPGAYTAPLRVAVRRQSDEAVVASRTYRVGGAVGADGNAQFTLVSDALTVPFTTERAADDYEILLGFGGEAAPAGKRKKK